LLRVLEAQRVELRRFLIARTGSEADADDLLNDLWVKVSQSHLGAVSNPRSYLFKMANNLVRDRIREARRRERRDTAWTAYQHGEQSPLKQVADLAPDAEMTLIEREAERRLANAISQIPPRAQRVLRMHKLGGLSHSEVARRLGITRSAVEKHMAVAMSHLRVILRD
jgi:RNA polymerase sigma factor (sigma-70 family)